MKAIFSPQSALISHQQTLSQKFGRRASEVASWTSTWKKNRRIGRGFDALKQNEQ
jgi:hypothetical protein